MAETTRTSPSRGQEDDRWPVPWQPVEGTEDGPLKRLEAALLTAFMGTSARLPEGALSLLLELSARTAFLLDRRHRRAAREFLRQALGEMSRTESNRRVLQAYRHFFRVVLEPQRYTLRVPAEEGHEHFDVEWSDAAREILAEGRGCVFVTPHLGSWEFGVRALSLLGFGPVYAVAKPVKNRPLSIHIQRTREVGGARLIPRRGAMADAVKVIRAGGALGMLLDQRARKRPVLAPFFGRPARCDRSAGVLVKRLGAPILVVSCLRTEKPLHWRFRFRECFQPEQFRSEKPEGIAACLNQVFEAMILEEPDQYFWLHDRYKDTPGEFPAPPDCQDQPPETGPDRRKDTST